MAVEAPVSQQQEATKRNPGVFRAIIDRIFYFQINPIDVGERIKVLPGRSSIIAQTDKSGHITRITVLRSHGTIETDKIIEE